MLTEHAEQQLLTEWLTLKKILFYAIPNGGSRHFLEAINLKKTGVKAGVPDICVPVARGTFHGLYIELKRKRNYKVSPYQKKWLEILNENGYCAKVAYGFEDAKSIIETYFKEGICRQNC